MSALSKSMFFALLGTSLFALAACGGSEETTEPAADTAMSESDAAMPADMTGEDVSEPADETAPAPGDLPAALTGTSWELVSIQSMSDAEGMTTPENPADYVLNLGPDGTVAMRLNCNRASGSWSAEESSAESGTFEFGPLAMTKALCPPPSLDDKIGRDAQYVRSYLLRDGMLHLSLMADGGIYSWAPAGASDAGGMAGAAPLRESYTGSVTGNDMVEKTFTAEAGQSLSVSLDSADSAFFNVLPPSAGDEFFPAIWVGRNEAEPDVFTGTAEESGTYRVVIYLLGNDKDTGVTQDYTLDVAVE